jgi:hypothetical protein
MTLTAQRWLKLTLVESFDDKIPLYLRPDHIVAVFQQPNSLTTTVAIESGTYYLVTETPDRVLSLLNLTRQYEGSLP